MTKYLLAFLAFINSSTLTIALTEIEKKHLKTEFKDCTDENNSRFNTYNCNGFRKGYSYFQEFLAPKKNQVSIPPVILNSGGSNTLYDNSCGLGKAFITRGIEFNDTLKKQSIDHQIQIFRELNFGTLYQRQTAFSEMLEGIEPSKKQIMLEELFFQNNIQSQSHWATPANQAEFEQNLSTLSEEEKLKKLREFTFSPVYPNTQELIKPLIPLNIDNLQLAPDPRVQSVQ